MKLKVLLLAGALALWGHNALAATDVRDCATIPGSIVGVSGGQCYWLKVNPDGSLTVTPSAGAPPYSETYLGNQDLTFTTSTALTPTATATIADIVGDPANSVSVSCWADGATPVAGSSGIPIAPLGSWRISTANLAAVRCTASVSSTIHIQYGK